MEGLYLADKEVMELYCRHIYPAQDRILKAIGKTFGKAFYLTGGTALSRFYFNHRLSEDLDLFTDSEDLRFAQRKIVKALEELGYEPQVEVVSSTFCRMFVELPNFNLKLDFAFDTPLEKPKPYKGFYLDTLKNIAVNKITAFEDRAELKDLVDLYFLVKEAKVELPEILDLADRKRVPIPYQELLTINTTGITGEALLIKPLNKKELTEFLKELKKALEENVKKKLKEAKKKIDKIINSLLWDFPEEERKISNRTLPVIKRRAEKLSYPKRLAVAEVLRKSRM